MLLFRLLWNLPVSWSMDQLRPTFSCSLKIQEKLEKSQLVCIFLIIIHYDINIPTMCLYLGLASVSVSVNWVCEVCELKMSNVN